ncbi:MAG: hypothetical protein ACKVKH_19030, partial [Verrucomicrobiales bacterium]
PGEGEVRGGWDGTHQADGSLFLERMGKDIFFYLITLDPESATPMLLGPDLRDWVTEDDLVHFVIEAIESLVPAAFHVML